MFVLCITLYSQTIAMRFGDGSGYVSIPDFLEFFTTPEQVRTAKASTAAVRMSLDLLQMEQEEEQELHDDVEGVEVDENMVSKYIAKYSMITMLFICVV